MGEETPIPIRQAAREVHKRVEWIRQELIEKGLLQAFRWGGSPDGMA